MEQHLFEQQPADQHGNPLFTLAIDPLTKTHLGEAAKWARFLAIVGMIFLAIMLLFFVIGGTAMFQMFSGLDQSNPAMANATGSGMVFMAFWLILIVVLWFFPLLYTLRFANGMRRALRANDQEALNTAFKNLKITLRFLGIVTIIFLVIYALAIAIALMATVMAR